MVPCTHDIYIYIYDNMYARDMVACLVISMVLSVPYMVQCLVPLMEALYSQMKFSCCYEQMRIPAPAY